MKISLIVAVALLVAAPIAGDANPETAAVWQAHSKGTAAGPVTNGLALSLQSESASYSVGQPMIVTLEIRNVSGSTEQLLLGSRSSAYRFSVVNISTGKEAARRPSRTQLDSVGGPSAGRPLPAGSSNFVRIDLNDLYVIGPGQYRVTATEAHIVKRPRPFRIGPSNTVTFEVLP